MRQKQSNIFNGSAVPYFGVPHEVVGTKHGSPMREMTYNALKLALVLYSKANRDWVPVVTLDSAAIKQRAGINKSFVTKAAKELQRFRIAQFTARKGVYTFILLDPATGKTLPSLNATVKDGPLTENEVVALAEAFGLDEMQMGSPTAQELKSLTKMPRFSTGALKFVCPCHSPSDKAGRTGRIRGKDKHISISFSNGHWVYRCEFPSCRLNGRRRTKVVKDNWNDYKHEVIVGGGGMIVDLVANLMFNRDDSPVTQQVAKAEMNRILGREGHQYEQDGQKS